jgi:integrase
LAEAIKLAKAANAKLMPMAADEALFQLITGDQAPTVTMLIDRFENEWLVDRKLAVSTLREIRIKLSRYRADLGKLMIGQLDVLALAEYLDGFSNNAYTKHRGLWIQIFTFAVAKGLADRNAADMTLVKQEDDKVRQRHTRSGVDAILSANTTPDWLKRAVRLAVLSLQRREDLVSWERSAADIEANTLRVSPGKTENYAAPINLEIEMGVDLRQVVRECLSEPIASPYLICYQPKARRREQIQAKTHWSAVTVDYFTKEFAKARDACGAYDHIENTRARPSVHELRALGAWLYEQQGFPTEYVQALLGHTDEKMTTYYQSGHTEKKVAYLKVSAGLKL